MKFVKHVVPFFESPREITESTPFLSSSQQRLQGWELLPVTFAARFIAVVWWFFCLILCSTYTANLAAHLSKLQHYPSSIEQLLAQTKIRYGCIASTTNCDFFRFSDNPMFRHAWFTMTDLWANETIFENYDEALYAVKNRGDFALFDDVSYFRSCLQLQLLPAVL